MSSPETVRTILGIANLPVSHPVQLTGAMIGAETHAATAADRTLRQLPSDLDAERGKLLMRNMNHSIAHDAKNLFTLLYLTDLIPDKFEEAFPTGFVGIKPCEGIGDPRSATERNPPWSHMSEIDKINALCIDAAHMTPQAEAFNIAAGRGEKTFSVEAAREFYLPYVAKFEALRLAFSRFPEELAAHEDVRKASEDVERVLKGLSVQLALTAPVRCEANLGHIATQVADFIQNEAKDSVDNCNFYKDFIVLGTIDPTTPHANILPEAAIRTLLEAAKNSWEHAFKVESKLRESENKGQYKEPTALEIMAKYKVTISVGKNAQGDPVISVTDNCGGFDDAYDVDKVDPFFPERQWIFSPMASSRTVSGESPKGGTGTAEMWHIADAFGGTVRAKRHNAPDGTKIGATIEFTLKRFE